MKVEILGQIDGLMSDDVYAEALTARWRDVEMKVIHPAQLCVAKGSNVLNLDQSDRQDGKHFGIMQWVVRGFLADLAGEAMEDDGRPFIDCCEYLMRFAISQKGIKLIHLGLMPDDGLWSVAEEHPNAKVRRFLQERAPRWRRQL